MFRFGFGLFGIRYWAGVRIRVRVTVWVIGLNLGSRLRLGC